MAATRSATSLQRRMARDGSGGAPRAPDGLRRVRCGRPSPRLRGLAVALRDLPDLRALHDLGERLSGDVVTPDAEGWDAARQAWNLAVDQRPVAVVYPESADDVVDDRAVRRRARICASRSTPAATTRARSTGRADTLLLKTERMRGIEIDAASAARARRGRGARRSRSPSRPASTGSRISPARRPTSASSATRSAAG